MGLLRRVTERFWFVPALMCLAAAGAAETLVFVDTHGQPRLPGWLGTVFYRLGEGGSRDLLGTIAAASLGVAGTTFSITIAVLALASSNYGPRLVRNFMADRGNQMVLGVYVATFLYSLLVLRSVRSPDDTAADGSFVPHLSVNVAVLLAIANVAVLVYFIHHISDSIQIATLSGRVRSDLFQVIDRVFPEAVGDHESSAGGPLGAVEPADEAGLPVHAGRPGYVQSIDADALLRLASSHDLVAVVRVRPGTYVLEDDPLLVLHPAERATAEVQESASGAFQVADARVPYQDVDFAVQQLTEVAVRALSPGTNDPYTAINALDDLGSGLARLVTREAPSPARADEQGFARLHASHPTAADLIGAVVDAMRWYAAGSPSVMHATLQLLDRIGLRARTQSLRSHLDHQVGLLREAFAAADHVEHDAAAFDAHAAEVRERLLGSPGGARRPRSV